MRVFILFFILFFICCLECPILKRAYLGKIDYFKKMWDHDFMLYEKTKIFGLDFFLMRALIWVESRGNERLISKTGALGICQIDPLCAMDFEEANGRLCGDNWREKLFNVEQNILVSCYTMRKLIDRYGGDVRAALSAYNLGPRGFSRYRWKTGNRYYTPYVGLIQKKYGGLNERRIDGEMGL